MATLTINVSNTFETGPAVVYSSEEVKNIEIKGEKLESMLRMARSDAIGFEVASLVEGGVFIAFIFNRSMAKKGATIEVMVKPDGGGLKGRINGEFAVKLRPGVKSYLQGLNESVIMRITSITLNDGKWSGFNAYLERANGLADMSEFFETLPTINDFSIK